MIKIIIAGAGFGGVRAALDISKYLPDAKITLINDTPYHCFHADLYEVVSAVLAKERRIDFKNLGGTINIPLSKIFNKKNIEILMDIITEIDLEKSKVLTQNSKALEYDFLVLGLGSRSNYYGIKGAEEFSHPLKNTGDALNIRNDLEEQVENSEKYIKVIIAGGGYTGVETAGQLITFLDNISKKYNKDKSRISILEATENILPGMPPWAQESSLKRLEEIGVEVKLNSPIKKVESNKIYCDNGEEVAFDYLIWTAGISGENLNGQIKGASFTKKNKIETNSDLSLEGYSNVFVLGDLAECMDKQRGCPVGSTAWSAIGQGKVAAKNIVSKIKNNPSRDYISPTPVFVVPVGRKFALSNLGKFKIAGIAGWLLKRFIALHYFLSILPILDAVSTWRKGVTIYLAND